MVKAMTDVLSTLELPLLERLRSQLRSLSPAERRVADTILRDPLGIIHMSVSELATLAETSAATVVRLCTSIGLRGYQELKITLATQSMLNGFLDQLEKYPNLTNVGTEFGDLEVSTYISATSNLLAQHPDLFGVFTTFAAPANGALASIAQNKSDTIVVGGYASKDENLVNALKDGRMGAIVDFDWYQLGYQTTEQMLAAIRDGEPQPEQSLGAAITTVDNIDDLTKADAGC